MVSANVIQIYIRIIDGLLSYIPIKAEDIGPEQYKILPYIDYNPDDRRILYEFKPNDLALVKNIRLNH
jgi:hypothetical protein